MMTVYRFPESDQTRRERLADKVGKLAISGIELVILATVVTAVVAVTARVVVSVWNFIWGIPV